MKFLLLTIIFLFFAFGCNRTPPIELTPPVGEIRRLVLEDVLTRVLAGNTKIAVRGIRTEFEKPGVYLVFAEVEIGGRKQIDKFIARRQESAEENWSLIPATEGNLNTHGIAAEDAK